MGRLSRRVFVAGAGTAGLGLLASCANPFSPRRLPQRVYRVGYLAFGPDEVSAAPEPGTFPPVDTLRESLLEYGYVEGQNLALEVRVTDGGVERARDLAEELVRLPVDLIVAIGLLAAQGARRATTIIPIAFVNVADPIGGGLVASLARPGSNATGLALQPQGAFAGKLLELLKQAVPTLQLVALLQDAADSTARADAALGLAAQTLGVQLLSFEIRDADDIPATVGAIVDARAQGLLLRLSARLATRPNLAQLAALALQHGLPGIYAQRIYADVGGLMGYGADVTAAARRAAYYVDRILKGVNPADLPVEQPMTFDFVVNMKTAQALGITFPNEIMLQVTEVIQ